MPSLDNIARGYKFVVPVQNRGRVGKLKRVLWPDDSPRPVNMWAILDAARDPAVFGLASRCYLEKCCLFAGELSPELARTAPYLVQVTARDSICESLLNQGWGQAWGVFLQSDDSIGPLRRHLRTLLRVKDHTGKYFLFRYYDPRVLRTYLPSCVPGELKAIFGTSIMRFCMEGEDPDSLVSFQLDEEHRLKTDLLRIQNKDTAAKI